METISVRTQFAPKRREMTKEEVEKIRVRFSRDYSRYPCTGFPGKVDNVNLNTSNIIGSCSCIDNIKL